MDGGRGPFGGAKSAESAYNGPESIAQNKTAPASTANSRHSPVTPLAPLEFLQNQRRGSITDPSLHAAGASGVANFASSPPSSSKQRQSDPAATLARLQSSPSYRFGEASSAQPSESSSSNFRRILRSPPPIEGRGREERREAGPGQDSKAARDSHHMEVDTQNPHQGLPKSLSGVDYQGRRPSLAGTKRKMSPDAASASSDIDPQLIGPGVPSGTNAEGEERVSKRRSSAFETHRMEYLNLQDRRGSGDGRVGTPGTGGSGSGGGGSGGGGQQQWWGSERREAASTPVFANTPVTAGGYTTTPSSAFADGSPHGRPPPSITTFAWPTANPPADPGQKAQPPQPANEASMAPNPQSPYDPNLAMLPPPGSFPHDRRMSVPAIAPENMPASPASASSRALRSRSRPTSRTRANQSAGTSTEQSPGPSNSAPEDGAGLSHLPSKESGSTPYSRSPELRVSHKLAERKRRKEMKDLFDELRDQLPADRGMKASKWEILSKAIDFIGQLKQTHQEMSREIDMLRHEVDGFRQGIPPPFGPGGPPHSVVYGHGPPVGVPQFQPGPPGPPGSTAPPPHPQHVQPPPPHTTAQQPPHSRPGSSQNAYPPGVQPHPNGTSNTSATENTS